MSASVSHYDQVRSLDELIGELKILNERGYKILEPIGEGQTRAAYKVLYEKGPVRRLRVLKLPKTQIQDRSVTTRVNLRAGDVNEREVLTLNEIRNPHISNAAVTSDFSNNAHKVSISVFCGRKLWIWYGYVITLP